MTDLTMFSATQLLALYRTGETSPVEVTDAVLARSAALQPTFNAYRALVDAAPAQALARASEARWRRGEPLGLLDGVPVGVKDLLDVAGFPTRRGSLATSEGSVREDGPPAARLREHGAILIGKTNTSEFGWRGLTESALAGITRNPWNPAHTPAGSSGGAAAAAALGLGPLQIGTDGGGSIRVPAAACGVFGLKPSFGRIPSYPPAHTGTVFHVGPITRTVADAALLLNVLSGPDARDWYALPPSGLDYLAELERGVSGLRIAYSRDLGIASVTPEVGALVDRAADSFNRLGAHVELAEPGFEDPAPIQRLLWGVGAAKLLRGIPADRHDRIEPALRELADTGEHYSLAEYLSAVDRRMELGIWMRRFHERYDLLLTPTLAAPAPLVGTPPSAPFCSPFNLTQQPACTVPCGFTEAGLPVGLQIVGPAHRDELVLRAARAFEAAHPFQRLAP